MYTYPIRDLSGRQIASISLENDEMPRAIMHDSLSFFLGGFWKEPEKEFSHFVLHPEAAEPKEKAPVHSKDTQHHDLFEMTRRGLIAGRKIIEPMELDWKDIEYEEPTPNSVMWIYLGGNQVELAILEVEGPNRIWTKAFDHNIIFAGIVQAWAHFNYPPVPRRRWSTE